MKSITLIVMIIFGALRLSAQNLTSSSNPNIINKPDTIHYIAQGYNVSPNAKAFVLLKTMEGFTVDADTAVSYQGQLVNHVRVNGKHYDGMTIASIITNLPVATIDNVEVIDDYSLSAAMTSIKTGEPEKILNINLRKNLIVDLNSFSHTPVQPNGYQPTRLQRTDALGRPRQLHTDEFNIADRTRTDRLITRQIARLEADIAIQGKDVDEYGDQIPHFLIDPWKQGWKKKAKVVK